MRSVTFHLTGKLMTSDTADLIPTPDGPMTRSQAAKHYRINKNTLIRRIWSGWPPERWFEDPYKSAKRRPAQRPGGFVTPYGKLTLWGVAEALDIDFATLRYRLYVANWPEEEAFNTPLYGARGKQFILPPEEYRKRRTAVLEASYKKRVETDQARRDAYNRIRRARRLREAK